MDENPKFPAAGAGGFMVPSLPSPAPSTSTIRSVSGLPHPRRHALRPGSAKEDKVRNFVSDRMTHISRRFAKKADPSLHSLDGVQGYKTMGEVCKDLEGVIDIVWLSGTPSLQVPYLLNIAGEFNTLVVAFPPSPVATFAILRKLDHCFASLLAGEDIETGEPLPGFENGPRSGLGTTDMVRCRSIVEQTRVLIVDVMNKEPGAEDDDDSNETGERTATEAESGPEGPGGSSRPVWDEDEERLYMDVARVYENTLVKLGERLGGSMETVQISDD